MVIWFVKAMLADVKTILKLVVGLVVVYFIQIKKILMGKK